MPALAIPRISEPELPTTDKTGEEASKSLHSALESGKEQWAEQPGGREVDISDESIPIPELSRDVLPKCPKCKDGLLRPGVVWFGETLPLDTLGTVDQWLQSGKVDLMLVIGTSSKVYPAAGYVDKARARGARIAVVNMDRNDVGSSGLRPDDWLFQGDAGAIVPEILKDAIYS